MKNVWPVEFSAARETEYDDEHCKRCYQDEDGLALSRVRAYVAKTTLAAGRAGIKFHSFTYDDASVFATIGAVALQTPQLFVTCGVFITHRVRKSFNDTRALIHLTLLREIELSCAIDVNAIVAVAHIVTRIAKQVLFGLLCFFGLVLHSVTELIRRH